MPFPLLPLVAKGVLIALKSAATAKKVAVASKAIGTATGASSAVSAGVVLATVGGVAWTQENYRRASNAYAAFQRDDMSEAATEIGALFRSISTVGSSDIVTDYDVWVDAGRPLDRTLINLVQKAKRYADEAKASHDE